MVISNTLNSLSRHAKKNFKDMTREDVISFLDSIRKSETVDPTHRWIGTYNLYLRVISTFFKWLYYQTIDPKERPKPEVLQNLKQLKRKEKSAYKPSDMWKQEDDLLFFKYCPSKRDRAYHAISRDSSCRPSEILRLKIKDLVFKMVGDQGRQYAEIVVNGKTGNRSIPLINSIPYVKDLLDSHPQRNNPNAYLIHSERIFGRGISIHALHLMYKKYKTEVFPFLLKDPLLDSNDKVQIIELLKKPWNPYIRRHSALTEKSKILKESTLRQHAGWTPNSNMHIKYVHYYGNESNESILEAYGLKTKLEEIDRLKPKICPNCNEQNKIDSRFCSKCKMILSYDEYIQTVEHKKMEKSDYEKLDAKIDALARHVLSSQTLVYKDRPYDTPIRTLEPWEMQNPDSDKRPMTDEEIEHKIERDRTKRNLRRKAEKKLLQDIEDKDNQKHSKKKITDLVKKGVDDLADELS